MLDSGDVDAVITCVPHYLHPEIGIAALRHGIHALVEKPAGVYTKQVARAQRVRGDEPELTFAIMFNQRNNPLYRRIKEIVDAGEIGAIRHTNWIITTWWRPQGYYDQSAWRATWGGEGGGVLVNQAPHQLDLLQWICGIPQSVFAKVAYGFRRNIAVEDEVTARRRLRRRRDRRRSSPPCTTWSAPTGSRSSATSGKIVVENSKTATVTRLTQARTGAERRHEHGRREKLFTGQLDLETIYTSGDHRVRVGLGRPARRRAGELRREHPRRHPAAGPGLRRHQRGPAGQRHPPVELDRRRGPARLRRGRATWPSSTGGSATRATFPSGNDHLRSGRLRAQGHQ